MSTPVLSPTSPDVAAYQPRDVVNAPSVKAAILRRSAERGDDEDMAAWLQNHFFRWAIGSFDKVASVASVADHAHLTGQAPPAWLARQLQAAPMHAIAKSFFYLDPDHPLLVDQERKLVEFLRSRRGTRLEQKLQRINCFQALSMWEEEHRRMRAKRSKGWVPSSGQALTEVLRTPNGIVFEFDGRHPALREEMAYESYHMQHCLGQFADMKRFKGGYGAQYADAAEAGQLRLFTLRSAGNQPHVTLSFDVRNGELHIDQIKGKQNRHPVRRYVEDVRSFLQHLPPAPVRHADCEAMGLVFEPAAEAPQGGQWKFVTEVTDADFLLSVMNGNFHLIEHFEQPPAALQWLLLRIAPYELGRLKRIDAAVAAAARATVPPSEWPPALQGRAVPGRLEIEGIALDAALCAPVEVSC